MEKYINYEPHEPSSFELLDLIKSKIDIKIEYEGNDNYTYTTYGEYVTMLYKATVSYNGKSCTVHKIPSLVPVSKQIHYVNSEKLFFIIGSWMENLKEYSESSDEFIRSRFDMIKWFKSLPLELRHKIANICNMSCRKGNDCIRYSNYTPLKEDSIEVNELLKENNIEVSVNHEGHTDRTHEALGISSGSSIYRIYLNSEKKNTYTTFELPTNIREKYPEKSFSHFASALRIIEPADLLEILKQPDEDGRLLVKNDMVIDATKSQHQLNYFIKKVGEEIFDKLRDIVKREII